MIFYGGFNGDLIPDASVRALRNFLTIFFEHYLYFFPPHYLILDFMLRLTRKVLILLMNLLLKVIRKLKNLLLKLLKRTRMRKISLMNWKNSWKRRRKIFLKIFLKESTDRGRYLLAIFPFFQFYKWEYSISLPQILYLWSKAIKLVHTQTKWNRINLI